MGTNGRTNRQLNSRSRISWKTFGEVENSFKTVEKSYEELRKVMRSWERLNKIKKSWEKLEKLIKIRKIEGGFDTEFNLYSKDLTLSNTFGVWKKLHKSGIWMEGLFLSLMPCNKSQNKMLKVLNLRLWIFDASFCWAHVSEAMDSVWHF